MECTEIFFPCYLSLNEKPQMLQNRAAAKPFLAKLFCCLFFLSAETSSSTDTPEEKILPNWEQ